MPRALRAILILALLMTLSLGLSGTQLLAQSGGPGDFPEISWSVLGPFPSGVLDPEVDPIQPWGLNQPESGYPSPAADSGFVNWEPVKPDYHGDLVVRLSGQGQDAAEWHWGWSASLMRYYFLAEFELSEAGTYRLAASRGGDIEVNGRPFYCGGGAFQPPVPLNKGLNRVLFKVTSTSRELKFHASFLKERQPVRLGLNDVTSPDLVIARRVADDSGFLIGVPVINCTGEWLEGLTLSGGGVSPWLEASTEIDPIPPYGVLQVALTLPVEKQPFIRPDKRTFDLPLKVEGDGVSLETAYPCPVVEPDDPRRETFISSIDDSVQSYGVRLPFNYDRDNTYGAVVAFHPAGVDCVNWLYEYAGRKDAFIIAPQNRRAGGFHWQDWGRVDALEAIGRATFRYGLDMNRLHATGSGMGGHGALHLAEQYPDMFASLAITNPWIHRHSYRPLITTRLGLSVRPQLNKIFSAGMLADSPFDQLANLGHLPIVMALGAQDGVTPPIHGRTIHTEMIRAGLEPELLVFDGAGDYFDDDKRRPGSDSADMRLFEQLQQANARAQDPDEITLVVTDELISDGAWWVDGLRRWDNMQPGSFSVVRDTENRILAINSENISGVILEPGMVGDGEADWTIHWNGEEVFPAQQGVKLAFAPNNQPPELDPALPLGAMKYALMRSFVIVPGSGGSDADDQLYLDIARAEAARWMVRANGRARVILDADFDFGEIPNDPNLYLIGAAGHNTLTDRYLPNTPLHVFNGRLNFNAVDYGAEKGSRFTWPRVGGPGSVPPSNLYLTGTDARSVYDAFSFDLMLPDRSLPHYLITDRDTPWRGWEGLVQAGYYYP